MDIMLTSFGTSHLHHGDQNRASFFHRMPPVSPSEKGQLLSIDYNILLIFERIIIDKKTYDRLVSGRNEAYGSVALTIKMLYDEGFVRLEDFDSIIAENYNLLEASLERDLKEITLWIEPFKKASNCWQNFLRSLNTSLRNKIFREQGKGNQLQPSDVIHNMPMLHDEIDLSRLYDDEINLSKLYEHYYGNLLGRYDLGHISYRPSSFEKILDEYIFGELLDSQEEMISSIFSPFLRKKFTDSLSYVNTNLLLSNIFQSAFHDWNDFLPLYQEKFIRVARSNAPAKKEMQCINQLFKVSFPELISWHPKKLLRALKDKRIVNLRQLISEAAEGKVTFDQDFAVRTLYEVFKIEKSIGSYKNFTSYATIPLGFIPVFGNPIQKAVEEMVTRSYENRKRKDYQWFYLISELAGGKSPR